MCKSFQYYTSNHLSQFILLQDCGDVEPNSANEGKAWYSFNRSIKLCLMNDKIKQPDVLRTQNSQGLPSTFDYFLNIIISFRACSLLRLCLSVFPLASIEKSISDWLMINPVISISLVSIIVIIDRAVGKYSQNAFSKSERARAPKAVCAMSQYWMLILI